MTEVDSPRVGAILLAAGSSTRMGRAKQLIEFEGRTLLRRAAAAIASSSSQPAIVVLGAEAERCRLELNGLDVNVCINDEWASGISSSIKAGLSYLIDIEPRLDAVMITLCDQPYVTDVIIDNFIAAYRSIRPPVIASEYNSVLGVPALFSRDMFDQILNLEGDRGARELIRDAGERVILLSVPEAAYDIDSPNDLMSFGDPIK